MKRKLTSILLMSALLVGGASTFVSCKDFDGDSVAENNAKVAGLDALLKEKIQELNDLKTKVDGQGEKIDDLLSRVTTAENKLNSVIWIIDYESELKAWALAQKDDQLLTYLYGLKSVCPDYEDLVTKQYLAQYCSADTKEFVDAIEACINKKIAEYSELEGIQSIEDFMDLVNMIPTFVEAAEKKLTELEGQDKLLNARIDKLVTSVNVDMVSNPIYGTFNTPFGIKSKVLIGFVGGEIEGKEFAGQDVKGGLAASLDAGNVYLTVNPAEVDAEGWSLDLVGRDGKPAPGFGKLVLFADNTPVTTISTRASNGLGGYVAAAKLDDAAAAKVVIDKEGLKDVAKNVLGKLRGQEALDITKAVRTIYNQVKNITPQYYAIKCQVKDGETKTKTYVSDYNIAAVTVKPLAYTTLADKNFRDIPQIPSLQDKLGAIISKIEYDPIDANSVKDFDFVVTSIANPDDEYNDFSRVAITVDEDAKTITIPYYDDTTQKNVWAAKATWNEATQWYDWEYKTVENRNYSTITIPYSKIKIEKVNVLEDGWMNSWIWDYNEETGRFEPVPIEHEYQYIMKYTVTISHDELKSIVSEINTQMSGIVNDVNNMFDKVSDLAAAADGKLALVNKLINKTNYTIDNINQYLQPIALAVCEGKAVRLSEVPGCYTQFKVEGNEGSIVLAPTSYTLELLAPAYKKSIKVDNKELNPTLDGSVKTVDVTLGVGNHTITVSSMDFYGNVVTKNYYVQVVK